MVLWGSGVFAGAGLEDVDLVCEVSCRFLRASVYIS